MITVVTLSAVVHGGPCILLLVTSSSPLCIIGTWIIFIKLSGLFQLQLLLKQFDYH